EQPPVPFVGFFAPLRGTIAINEAVVENVGPLVAVVRVEMGERAAQPEIVAARGHAGDGSNHVSGRAAGPQEVAKPRLRPGDNKPGERCALKTSANASGVVMKAPGECGVEIGSRLNSGRRQRSAADDSRESERQCEMRSDSVSGEAAHR